MRVVATVVVMMMAAGASGQVLKTWTYATVGHPTEALATADRKYVLVTVNMGQGVGRSSGIEVFQVEGEKLKKVAVQELGKEGAQGILVVPGSKPEMVAVGLSNAGVAFLPLAEVLRGKAKTLVVGQGEQSGSGYLAVSPDGQYLFVANEYGGGGNVGVIAMRRDEAGGVHPETVGHVRTPSTTPGVAISGDGRRIYTEGELAPAEVAGRLPGHGVKELERTGCMQAAGKPGMPNGVLYVIDAAKAEALTAESTAKEASGAVLTVVDAGCSPVREAVTADGGLVYVTARGDDRVLVFDAKLLESAPEKAFVRGFASGGTAPVGLKLFDGGKMLLVANSNRFAAGMTGSAAVFDLSDPAAPKLVQTIATGEFPRNITASADGETLYMTVFSGDELMVLKGR